LIEIGAVFVVVFQGVQMFVKPWVVVVDFRRADFLSACSFVKDWDRKPFTPVCFLNRNVSAHTITSLAITRAQSAISGK
jgi:hypothetical protein